MSGHANLSFGILAVAKPPFGVVKTERPLCHRWMIFLAILRKSIHKSLRRHFLFPVLGYRFDLGAFINGRSNACYSRPLQRHFACGARALHDSFLFGFSSFGISASSSFSDSVPSSLSSPSECSLSVCSSESVLELDPRGELLLDVEFD